MNCVGAKGLSTQAEPIYPKASLRSEEEKPDYMLYNRIHLLLLWNLLEY